MEYTFTFLIVDRGEKFKVTYGFESDEMALYYAYYLCNTDIDDHIPDDIEFMDYYEEESKATGEEPSYDDLETELDNINAVPQMGTQCIEISRDGRIVIYMYR